MYVRAEKDAESELFKSQIPTFLALTKNCKSVEVVREISGVPAGCGSELLTPTIFVHVLVKVRIMIPRASRCCHILIIIGNSVGSSRYRRRDQQVREEAGPGEDESVED